MLLSATATLVPSSEVDELMAAVAAVTAALAAPTVHLCNNLSQDHGLSIGTGMAAPGSKVASAAAVAQPLSLEARLAALKDD
jgi:hypothetical protein